MDLADLFQTACGNFGEIPNDWMSATQVRPIIFEDPALIWLEYYGDRYGFRPDESPYEFLKFIGRKGFEFQEKYGKEVMPAAPSVCKGPWEVRRAEKLQETLELMGQGVPVICQPALWWAPERIYGVPDFLVLTSWLKEKFPEVLKPGEDQAAAMNLKHTATLGHYVVLDVKFTTKLEESQKATDFANYRAQVRVYSFLAGKLQGFMPKRGFMATRDHPFDPLAVDIFSSLDGPLDEDLAAIREKFIEIKTNGGKYTPWKDEIVVSNFSNEDERWDTAKDIIAHEKIPGRDPEVVYQISRSVKRELAQLGFANLDMMLKIDPANVPLEKCKGIGPKRAKQIRSILKANRSRTPVVPNAVLVPKAKEFEFYVDFEYFTNVNVDFETQWPTLEGYEMIFMVGVGWEERGDWKFETFISSAEKPDEERRMIEAFLGVLQTRTNGAFLDGSRAVYYHWSSAEVWQGTRAADRHGFPKDHPLRRLPWSDLQKVFVDGPASIPGAWNFKLKEVAKALSAVHAAFATEWPGDLDKGLRAMVMGWNAYKEADPLKSHEMGLLKAYLEADCKALWNILRWLRTACKP